MGGISIWQLLIIVVIVVLLFGTKKLSSLGSSIKGFKKAMSDEDEKKTPPTQDADFSTKTLAEKQEEARKEEIKRHDDKQV